MAQIEGKCTNFGNCETADKGRILVVSDKAEFVCEECGKQLIEVRKKSKFMPILIALVILVIAGLAAVKYVIFPILFPAKPLLLKIISPASGQTFTEGGTIMAEALVTSGDTGSVSRVAFYLNGKRFGNPLSAKPYKISLQNLSIGEYIIKAIAEDASGKVLSSDESIIKIVEKVQVAVNQAVNPPQVSRTETPASGLESKIERIRKRGKMIVGVYGDAPPFGFVENGQSVGFDIDLMKAIAEEWRISAEFVVLNSEERILALLNGKADIIAAAMTHTKDREEAIDFSQTYFMEGQSLLTRSDSKITGLISLSGAKVGVLKNTTAEKNIENELEKLKIKAQIIQFDDTFSAIEAVKKGELNAYTDDSGILSYFTGRKYPGILKIVGTRFSQEPYGLGVTPGDSDFRNWVDYTLQKLKLSGKYDEIYWKWFNKSVIPPYDLEILQKEFTPPFVPSNRTALSKMDKIIRERTFIAAVRKDFKPFSYMQNGDLAGFDIDIMREFARRWIGDKHAVKFIPISGACRMPVLEDEASAECPDKADILAAAMTRTNDREMRIDFSQTYFVDRQRLLVKKTSAISSVCQLNGKLVGVAKGATTAENLRKESAICNAVPEIREYLENSKAVQALKSGEIEAFATDSVALSKFAEEDPNLKIVGEPFGREPYGIGIPNNDSKFRDLVNLTLQAMKADGTYNAIYCRWFPNTTPYPVEIWPGTIKNALLKGMTLTDTPQIAECSSQMHTDKIYKIQSGDTLSGIADRYFGDPLLWTYIWEANKEVIGSNYNFIRVGQVLKIPEITKAI